MSKDYIALRDEALGRLKTYIDSLDPAKGKKLAYWIKDYTNFLKAEDTFQPSKLITYKRGAIVKVHLGYRVGSEEGGLHYAIVMDRNNSVHSPTLTVIPLTSVKPGVDLNKLPPSKIPIGNEVFTLLSSNYNTELQSLKQHMKEIEELLKNVSSVEDTTIIQNRLNEARQQVDHCEKMKKEVSRMKQGSIALVGQIVTVSKIRIYDPKYSKDALSKVRISDTTLDVLDAKIQELYGSKRKKQ